MRMRALFKSCSSTMIQHGVLNLVPTGLDELVVSAQITVD
eukprot:SAG11_NODE_3566_length_2367_cov_3.410935_1_plen_39_part_10